MFVNVIFAQELKQVNATKLNVRSGPSTEFEVVEQLENETVVKVISSSNGWSKLDLERNGEYYVSSKFLSSISKANDKKETRDEDEKDSNYLWTLLIVGFLIYYFFFKKDKSNSNRSYKPKPNKAPTYSKPEKQKFLCECCGYESNSLHALTHFNCNQSPTGKHVPFHKGVQPKYFCKYCGYESKSLHALTHFNCNKSPVGKHRPL